MGEWGGPGARPPPFAGPGMGDAVVEVAVDARVAGGNKRRSEDGVARNITTGEHCQ